MAILRAVACVLLSQGFGACGGGDDGGGDGSTFTPDCTLFTPAVSSPYLLPWHVGQSFVANPHFFRETSVQRYAYDVGMPIGTDILAMRAGEVVRVEESYFDGDNVFSHENYVLVQHEDGTVARYVHLTNRGALVQVGDRVQQGQPIGLSGHTGNSSAPHLHVDLTRSCCAAAPEYNALPHGETLPLSFRNASPDSSCGLLNQVRYTALP
jgi:murein DD-endopeptidase MepM/ murein hydrolase activator NlpD